MTLGEIRDTVLFQTNNDLDDLGDFMPYLHDYINQGYDRLVEAYAETHLGEEFPRLEESMDIPNIPEWTHHAIADWATWLVYRNGNPSRQNRGYPFRQAFEEIYLKIKAEGGRRGKIKNFFNIPR